MAHYISDSCICCGRCEDECPTIAISRGETKFVIDSDKCIDCSMCVAVCQSDAISQE